MEGYLRELKGRTVRRREGEVPARFGFYGAENVGCAAALVFVVAPCFPSWCSRRGWTDVGMQRDWLLVQTHLSSAKTKIVAKRPPSPGDTHDASRQAQTSSQHGNRRAACVCGC